MNPIPILLVRYPDLKMCESFGLRTIQDAEILCEKYFAGICITLISLTKPGILGQFLLGQFP